MSRASTQQISIETLSEQRCFGGVQGYYQHASSSTGTTMKFAVFQPSQAATQTVPALYYLAGLTCNEETFMIKAGAQRFAAEHGLILVACDTSPRGLGYADDTLHEDDDWDFGTGAGFYINATRSPWNKGYQMGTYIDEELPAVIEAQFPASPQKRGIFGHSMGGHGALVTGLRNPDKWHSISAFAPICNPSLMPWGQKAFTHYLGDDQSTWRAWDATELLRQPSSHHSQTILVDQGLDDQFLAEQLATDELIKAADQSSQSLDCRQHAGYDHSYYFIQSFIADHITHHAKILLA